MLRWIFDFPRGVLLLAAAGIVLHVATSGHYGIFRDEFYYLACADHLDWGYVDHPPLSILILKASRAILGDAAWAIRLLPAFAGAALVLLVARLARELGGGRFAQLLAALTATIAPHDLGAFGYFSMNAFDLVFWAWGALLLAQIGRSGEPRRWLLFGLVCGLGLQNKISMGFFACGAAVALVATPLRRHLRTPWPWLGALLAGLVFAPHVFWQIAHDWPTLEFIRNAQRDKIAPQSPLDFLTAQVLLMHPFVAPIWLLGLGCLGLGRAWQRDRGLAIAFLTAAAILVLQRSKPYYLAGAYPPLLAAGAVVIERFTARAARSWMRPALGTLLGIGGALLVPFAVPLLPVETFMTYQRALHVEPPREENSELGPLPQFFADRFGWQEMTATVARIHASLPETERQRTLIVGSNYGEAGALRYFGRRFGLPPAVSQHNSFYLWGPGSETPLVVITIGMEPEDLAGTFESVEAAGRLESKYAMPYETRDPICVCRGFKIPLMDAWRQGKHFI